MTPGAAPAVPDRPDPAPPEIAPERSALLLLDFQNDILGRNLSDPQRESLLARVGAVLRAARAGGLTVIHVVVRFRPGYPEVSRRDLWRRGIRTSGRLQETSAGAEIAAELAPLPGEAVVVKRRTGAFADTELPALLRAAEIDTLLLAGVSTGGSVLSTLRAAADLDYRLLVVADGCADPDPEVHRVLCDKVFPRQAMVIPAAEVLRALSGASP